MSKLSTYLASKYLTADPKEKTKKRKRKPTSGLTIADDSDILGLTSTAPPPSETDGPSIVNSGSAEFRKSKKNAWKTVGAPVLQPKDEAGTLEADLLIQAATLEKESLAHKDEDPVISDGGGGVIKMSDGTHAGLQSAASVSAQFALQKASEAASWAAEEALRNAASKGKGKLGSEETVYRDATGRRIDISLRRALAKQENDLKLQKEKEKAEAQKGDIQRVMAQARKMELDEARFIPFARKIDDEDMNAEMKEVERWNDPAAEFLSGGKEEGGKGGRGKKGYQGGAAPNRYGIRPGRRWDGVDRGNGWEDERFKAGNKKVMNKDLGYAWEMDE